MPLPFDVCLGKLFVSLKMNAKYKQSKIYIESGLLLGWVTVFINFHCIAFFTSASFYLQLSRGFLLFTSEFLLIFIPTLMFFNFQEVDSQLNHNFNAFSLICTLLFLIATPFFQTHPLTKTCSSIFTLIFLRWLIIFCDTKHQTLDFSSYHPLFYSTLKAWQVFITSLKAQLFKN